VLDLGSGAGNDCFVARTLVGETGKVTGLDFTEEMIQKARQNLAKTGFKNIEFIQGDIEEMPLPDSTFDVVISNCVLNLVPDKQKAFSEIFRVLKPGGHFCISDVVTSGELPEGLKEAAEMYAGCVSGATEKQEYLKIIEKQGFSQVEIQKENQLLFPKNSCQLSE
jgi:arsenite methyltransferase